MKRLNYWVQHDLCLYDGQTEPVDHNSADFHRTEALKDLEAMPDGFTYHPATRNSHFTALNCLPVVVGTRWTVSEDVRDEFLEMLPPITRKAGGFYISEASCAGPNGGNIRSAYYFENGQYWHEYEETSF
jgi:hypothetical protein